ncbi:MAG: FAD-dependent oxidoreductase [Chloroflexota bacterium]
MSPNRFQRLLEPGYIGKVQTRNRMIKTGAGVRFYNKEDGFLNDRLKGFYETLARGGVGLLIVNWPAIDFPLSTSRSVGERLDDDRYIPGYQELTDIIHKEGCPVFLQLLHQGPVHRTRTSGLQPVAASSLPKSEMPHPEQDVARELTVPEIEDIVAKFAAAAVRAQRAGFDGVEINAATTHLLNSFLSRAWNKRQDAYGASALESRARIVIEIIREIKRSAGQDFPVTVLLNGAEYGLEMGITIDESRGFACLLQEAGADAIQVRAEFYSPPLNKELRYSTHFPDLYLYPEPPQPPGELLDISRYGAGALVPLASFIKKAVSIPVIVVGRMDPELGESALRQDKVDFIALNRRLLADPELPNKVIQGRTDDIVPCSGCSTCFDFDNRGFPVQCRVNASFGKEREYALKPAAQKKRVLVAGGGPAGMEFARVAALRGHEVTICDREKRLGGLLPMAGLVKGFERENLMKLVRYFQSQLTRLGVTVHQGREVDLKLIAENKPDVVVVAAGGVHNVPELPGIPRRNFITSRDLHHRLRSYLRFLNPRLLHRLTRLWMPLGKRVVILGGGIQGCEVAEFLVKRGRNVTILETGDTIGEGLTESVIRPYLLPWLEKKGVTMLSGVKYEEISDAGLTITTREGKRQTIAADTFVTALPLLPNTALLQALEGSGYQTYAIGDCAEPRLILEAIADGARLAREI